VYGRNQSKYLDEERCEHQVKSLPTNQDNNSTVRRRQIRFVLLLTGVSLGLWIAFAKLVLPPIIESAYHGESLSVLNGLVQRQDTYSLDHYLKAWDTRAAELLVALLGLWLGVLLVVWQRKRLDSFVEQTTPGSVGAIRMWTCMILLLMMAVEDLSSIAVLPTEMRQLNGMMRYFYRLPGVEEIVTSETGLRGFQLLTEFVLFLGIIGLWTRIVIPLGALCVFVLLGLLIDYSFFWHQNLVPLYLMAVLSFSPCGDGWSVDRLRKLYNGHVGPGADRGSTIYGWSRYACWVVIALPYAQTGWAKVREGGLFWWNSTNMRSILYFDTLTPREFNWAFSLYLAPAPDILFALLGLAALLAELSYVMVLFSRAARRILPLVAIMMHTGIFLLQRVLFIDLILLQFVFFDFTRMRRAIGQRLAVSRGRLQVLYDGFCPLCRRTVQLLARFDLLARLEFLDFRQLDLSTYQRDHMANLTPEALEKQMHVVLRGRVYYGFYSFRAIAVALPAFWLLVPLLFLPGISSLGTWVYSHIARKRMKLHMCDFQCPTGSSQESVKTKDNTDGAFGYAFGVFGIAIFSFLCWFYRVEFYPLTSWRLYADADNSGKVTYLKVLARYESGMTARARLEDAVGAMRFDARYSRVIDKCFRSGVEVAACKKFLTVAGSGYNRKARPGGKIIQYQIEKWAWDFRSHPRDSNYGNPVDRFIHEIKSGGDFNERDVKLAVGDRR
jgi:predicted DCC family thiol-disulfide oxidoreductase YuxK